MSKLPGMPYRSRLQKLTQVQFGGLRHNDNARDGEIYDMQNLSSEHWPYLGTRERRGKVAEALPFAKKIYTSGQIVLTICGGDDQGLYYQNLEANFAIRLENLEEIDNVWFVPFGNRVLLMPQKHIINLTYPIIGVSVGTDHPEATEAGQAAIVYMNDRWMLLPWDGERYIASGMYMVEKIDSEIILEKVTIQNGTIFEKPATANTLLIEENKSVVTNDWGFREGDAVTISGMSNSINDRTAIIREIVGVEPGHTELHFSDNIFKVEDGQEKQEETGITLSRKMPEMDIMFEHNNRLWGAKGEEIFASKTGDPRNWNVFDGLATDSWHIRQQEGEPITGGTSFQYPRFFRERSVSTVYGASPSGFQTQRQELPGVKKGESQSLCRSGGILCWLSKQGIVLYNGSQAYVQNQVFGDWDISKMKGAGDGNKLYIYAELGKHPEADGEKLVAIFVYDTQKSMWTKENAPYIDDLYYSNGEVVYLHQYKDGGEIISMKKEENQENAEMFVFGSVEFGDFSAGSMERKGLQKVQIRAELEEGAYFNVWVKCDEKEWKRAGYVAAKGKQIVNLPVIIQRCDRFRLKIEGNGPWKIYGIGRKIYIGSDMH